MSRDIRQPVLTAAAIFALFVLLPDVAHAAGGFDKITSVLTSITQTVIGPLGKAICVLGIVAVGLMWVFGQMDPKRALLVVVGIGVIFGANEIAAALTGI
jgi:type IV secretory pathway VirB2 component (pilin)